MKQEGFMGWYIPALSIQEPQNNSRRSEHKVMWKEECTEIKNKLLQGFKGHQVFIDSKLPIVHCVHSSLH